MATRFYMSDDTFSTVAIPTIGTWGATISDHVTQFMYPTNPGDMAFVLESVGGSGQGTRKMRTLVSEGLSAGIDLTNAMVSWNCRYGQSSSSANTFSLFAVGIINSAGVLQQSLTGIKDSTEIVTNTGTPSSRFNTGTTAFTHTTSLNDRLVVQVGWDQDGSGSYTQVFSRGNTSGTDLSSTEGDTDIQNPWFEIDKTITFGGGEPPPPASNEDWEATLYISAILDEWV